MDSKTSGEKPAQLPTPAAAANGTAARRSTFRATLLRSLLVLAAVYALHRWTRVPRLHKHAGSTSALEGYASHGPLSNAEVEKLFLSVPDPTSAIAAHRLFATRPHLAGSPQDFETAKYFLSILQRELAIAPGAPGNLPVYDAGSPESRNATLSIPWLDGPVAWIDKYYPMMNTPLDRSLEILGDDGTVAWAANVEEIADDTDPEAGANAESVPVFHGLSRGGEVEGRLVYANLGKKEDYDALVAEGVDLKGKIVIVRYGAIFRGLKVKGAQELGAVGVLMYNDLRDDGTVTAANGYLPYPHGPARNPSSVQRGSVQFLSVYPGDPTTPGYPAYADAPRTAGTNIPAIPSLPVSWDNAQVLLAEIADGGRDRTVRLVNHVDDRIIPIWNTMGVIPGHIQDEVVVIGNHRDAWVMGATDPSSGTASVNEVIRGFGVLLRAGWKPLRTIVIASWDAEEYGLIGSTEWGEDFADWIDEHVVAYLNLDSSVSGDRFRASASPSLAHLVRAAAEAVPHPTDARRTLWDARTDRGPLLGAHVDAEAVRAFEEEAALVDAVGVAALGSGSDYTVFLQRIGVASGNAGFGPTLSSPVYHYHSVYDTVRWQELYTDPGFFRHVAVAKHLGLQALRLADSIVLPLNTTHYAHELDAYIQKVDALAASESLALDLTTLKRAIHALQYASRQLDGEKAGAEKSLREILDGRTGRHGRRRRLARLARRLACWARRLLGQKVDCSRKDVEAAAGHGCGHAEAPHAGVWPSRALVRAQRRVKRANEALVAFERGFISAGGIRDREWYRHLGVVPGKWLGYGATTLPGLTEALKYDRNTTLAEYEADRLVRLLVKLAETIRP